jgi:uncharacterized protein involved in oxidation of intracellular sulfur
MSQAEIGSYLFIINDSAYGNERTYNALRLALNMSKREDCEVRIFLMGDSVICAIAGQQTPNGYYNLERMVKSLVKRGQVAYCGTCVETRGIQTGMLVEGVLPGSMDMLGDWTLAADHVLVF